MEIIMILLDASDYNDDDDEEEEEKSSKLQWDQRVPLN